MNHQIGEESIPEALYASINPQAMECVKYNCGAMNLPLSETSTE
jgi:hypothetical protein